MAPAMSSTEVKRLEGVVRALLAHRRGEDGVDDDDVGGRAGLGEGVGEREGPGLGGGLGGAVGGVRAVGLLGLGRGDEDEAAALVAIASWNARVACWTVRTRRSWSHS